MYKVFGAQVELKGGFRCCCICHDKAKGYNLLSFVSGVLVGKVPEHTGETLFEVL